MNLSNLNDLENKIFGKNNQYFRKISYKVQFFRLLDDIIEKNENNIQNKIKTLTVNIKNSEFNNQPYNYQNIEVFYFYLYELFVNQIEKKMKEEGKRYLDSLDDYIDSISRELYKYKPDQCKKEEIEHKECSQKDNLENEYLKEEYEEEKKDIKKFLTILFSIINFDVENSSSFTQVANTFLKLNDTDKKTLMSIEEKIIKQSYGKNAMDKFKKILSNEKLYNSINHFNNITYSNNEIVIPEQCFSFDYIIEHNIFKKYENKIKN